MIFEGEIDMRLNQVSMSKDIKDSSFNSSPENPRLLNVSNSSKKENQNDSQERLSNRSHKK